MTQGDRRSFTVLWFMTMLLLPPALYAQVHVRTAAMLAELGYRAGAQGEFIDLKNDSLQISREDLRKGGIEYDEEGLLISPQGAWLSKADLEDRLAALDPKVAVAGRTFQIAPLLSAHLIQNGFSHDNKGRFTHKESGAVVTRDQIRKTNLDFDTQGRLVYMKKFQEKKAGRELPPSHAVGVLHGLLDFDRVSRLDARQVGESLKEWDIPPAFDGVHLVNADGSATYYGLMLYEGLKKNPSFNRKDLTGEKLSSALTNFRTAHQISFTEDLQYPFASHNLLQQGWESLHAGKAEAEGTPVAATPQGLASLRDLREAVEVEKAFAGGDADYREELEDSISTLNALEKQYYHPQMGLTDVPRPESPAPNSAALPKLLKNLDRVFGKPLSSIQKEALIKAFPMGETVWRMNAHSLWEKGLTGKGIKVAVIDTGTAGNRELRDALNSATDLIDRQPVPRAPRPGRHGTHVGGTIHALAPEAEIHSYDVFDDGSSPSERILEAVDAAVADGNHIINMSLGGLATYDKKALLERYEDYAKKGIVFVIASGNNGNKTGVAAPAIANGVIAVGALDVNDKMAEFTSRGSVYDPDRLAYRFKKLHMAPGTNINSTTGFTGDDNQFGQLDGTSMATPHVTGVSALLFEHIKDFSVGLDPVSMGERLRDAVSNATRPLARNKMPRDVSPHQEVVIVDPVAALARLEAGS